MEKSKYVEIRAKDNFLFLYYTRQDGIIKDEGKFLDILNSWVVLTYGIPLEVGKKIIVRYLDKKHNFIK